MSSLNEDREYYEALAKDKLYQPKTGQPCNCKRGIERDNCPQCEGTGMRIDFAAIHRRRNNNA